MGFRSEYPFGVPLGGVGISGAGEYIEHQGAVRQARRHAGTL
jgi:hypothetical protein